MEEGGGGRGGWGDGGGGWGERAEVGMCVTAAEQTVGAKTGALEASAHSLMNASRRSRSSKEPEQSNSTLIHTNLHATQSEKRQKGKSRNTRRNKGPERKRSRVQHVRDQKS